MNNPLITVAICVRNGERYISEAIESVIKQSLQPIQILVIDDGSDDSTIEIAKSCNCEVYAQEKLGLGKARNIAFDLARGEFLFLLDSDDLMDKDALKNLGSQLMLNSQAVGAIGRRQNFISPELISSIELQNKEFLLEEEGFLPSGSLWKKTLNTELKFDESLRVTDIDWTMRLQNLKLEVVKSQALVMRRRIHANNFSSEPNTRVEYLKLVRQRLTSNR
jgi:glycosyltransferase involved in cell wall biosynthesis